MGKIQFFKILADNVRISDLANDMGIFQRHGLFFREGEAVGGIAKDRIIGIDSTVGLKIPMYLKKIPIAYLRPVLK